MKRPLAISFDLGQTLVDLDETCLAEQAVSQGYELDPTLVHDELALAWKAYNVAKSQKLTGYSAWSAFMHRLLERVGVKCKGSNELIGDSERDAFVRYLWSEQPKRNLWRKPIAGIPELLADLAAANVPIGILTNSEGRAKELVDEVGFGRFVQTVVDSGLEGIEKPDPKIFHTLAERLGYAPENIVHVGDSFEADVLGALGVGMTPVWLALNPTVTLLPGVQLCRNTDELRRLLLPN
jgi:putative hydrolase of the HAD superfamily